MTQSILLCGRRRSADISIGRKIWSVTRDDSLRMAEAAIDRVRVIQRSKELEMSSPELPIVVTGISSGIGAETASMLTARGHSLIGVDRNAPEAFDGEFVQADLSTPGGVKKAAAEVMSAAPHGIQGLANIAGVPGTAPVETVLAVNVFAVRNLTNQLAKNLVPGAAVVNLSSSVAFDWRSRAQECRDFALSADEHAAISAAAAKTEISENSYLFSKQCVRALTESLAANLLENQVRVNSVSPGPVETPILDDFKKDHGQATVNSAADTLGRFGRPADIAAVICYLVSDGPAWINGTDIRVDGGLIAYRSSQAG